VNQINRGDGKSFAETEIGLTGSVDIMVKLPALKESYATVCEELESLVDRLVEIAEPNRQTISKARIDETERTSLNASLKKKRAYGSKKRLSLQSSSD